LGTIRAWLCHCFHQLGQPNEVVSRGGQREHPADAGETTMTGRAEAGGRLGPAKHLLDALAHPPTDGVAGMAGRASLDCRAPMGGVLRDVRRLVVLPQIGDKADDIIGLVGSERHPVIAASCRRHVERGLAFRHTGGQGQTHVDHQSMSVLHQNMAQIGQLGRLARPFALQPSVGSVVEACGWLLRFSPWRLPSPPAFAGAGYWLLSSLATSE